MLFEIAEPVLSVSEESHLRDCFVTPPSLCSGLSLLAMTKGCVLGIDETEGNIRRLLRP